jgi:NAD(P)-dependent dehydrogenase (short-subunit alcohol dehydrogenase family)
MNDSQLRPVLAGKKALVVGVANEDSIAYGCAKAFRSVGADLAISWLNEKARRWVEPLAHELEASITGELDVTVPGQLEAIFDQIREKWGRLDILVHSIAFAPKEDLQGGLLNCSADGGSPKIEIREGDPEVTDKGLDVSATTPRLVQGVLQQHIRRSEFVDHGRVEILAPELGEPSPDDGLVFSFLAHLVFPSVDVWKCWRNRSLTSATVSHRRAQPNSDSCP